MVGLILAISVISMIVFIYILMGDSSVRYIIAPIVGLLFGYLVYTFGMSINMYILFVILALPVIGMIFALASGNHNKEN